MYAYHILGRLAQERHRELQREAAQAHLGEVVGCAGVLALGQLVHRLGRIAQAARWAWNGRAFRSDAWNRGYATEAATATRDYAFQTLRLPRLISLVRQRNGASQRVAEKVGMCRAAALERFGYAYWRYELSPNANS
jgi:RimJ/RimL family protein N-acetyltransferase